MKRKAETERGKRLREKRAEKKSGVEGEKKRKRIEEKKRKEKRKKKYILYKRLVSLRERIIFFSFPIFIPSSSLSFSPSPFCDLVPGSLSIYGFLQV